MRASIILSILLLTGCGQKGPLYLPSDSVQSPETMVSDDTKPSQEKQSK